MKVPRETIAAIRFGYGFRPGETPSRDAAALLATLAPGAALPFDAGPDIGERAARFARFNTLRRENRDNSNRSAMARVQKSIRRQYQTDIRVRALTPVLSPYGFYERLAWFWSNHFAVGGKNLIGKALVGRFEKEAIRPHLAGPFNLLLRAAVTHPAMLLYLDQDRSMGPDSSTGRRRKAGLNENLSREIMELHSLGVGSAYTQGDVRQFAELLTGLGFNRRTGITAFTPARAEPGAETVLGARYGGGPARLADIYRALDDLAANPATARHIARKLAVHFTSDAPSNSLIDHLATAYRRTGGNLSAVYAALLDHDESWSSFGDKVKQPFDFIVSSLRAIGPTPAEIAAALDPADRSLPLIRAMRRLAHTPLEPPGPQGWPESAAKWITPQGLTSRIEWASRLGRIAAERSDPRAFLDLALGGAASPAVSFAAVNAAERWEGIALVLASSEFNRR
ncbi:DUF1800 domain-containing protein [Pikeienuella piscinae]|uniref:DUF1800 domain-containing protein n=1 Tax=Pikeienuella piscinae TaxID=2748098 RepID=UPI001FE6E637|nr:DUF1800 domain-containing protein [Pikeienuella piscinae]